MSAAVPETLTEWAAFCHANSARWFPHIHDRGHLPRLVHFALGAAGEAGEVANKTKKLDGYRPDQVVDHFKLEDAIAEECIDTLAYVLNILAELGRDVSHDLLTKQLECERRWG